MIVTLGNEKGGVSKTTLALTLGKHYNAAVIDCDIKQKSAYTKGKAMGINCTLLPDDKNQVSFIKKLKEKSTKKNLIIFDTGGKSTAGSRMAMAVANLVIIPYCYSSLDSRGLEETLSTIEELKAYGADPKFKVLLSKIDSRTSAHVYGIKELEQRGLPHFNFCIGNYRSFVTSINENMTVLDTNDEKAKACIQQLIRAIDKELFGK